MYCQLLGDGILSFRLLSLGCIGYVKEGLSQYPPVYGHRICGLVRDAIWVPLEIGHLPLHAQVSHA
jgi:hypothetical protein